MSEKTRSGRAAGALAAASLGALQLAVGAGSGPTTLAEEAASLFCVAAGFSVVGLVLGRLLESLAARLGGATPEALAAALAAIGALATWSTLDPGRVLAVSALGAVAASLLVGLSLALLLDRAVVRAPWATRAAPWAVLLAVASLTFALRSPTARRAPEVTTPASRTAPCVLLVTLDTLRADRLPAYGHAAGSTPVLDGLARDGALFRSVASQSHLTGPSHLTILSGLRPDSHGIYDNAVELPPGLETIASVAASRGMETAAFVGAWPVAAGALGATTRFQWADEDMRQVRWLSPTVLETSLGWFVERLLKRVEVDQDRSERPAGEVNAQAFRWLERGGDRPFFLWAHYYDPHLPYEAPAAHRPELADAPEWYDDDVVDQNVALRESEPEQIERARAALEKLYDAEISYSDAALGELIDKARERAGERPLWVFVTSDHGESFGEHGNYYWRDVYQPTMWVPLFVRPPEPLAEPVIVEDVVGLVDVAPTIAAVVGGRWEESVDGRSLLPFLSGADSEWSPEARSSVFVNRVRRQRLERRQEAVRDGRYKLIRKWEGWGRVSTRRLPETLELYDLESDPGETVDLADEMPDVVARLLELLPEPLDAQLDRALELTPEQRQRLEALGYL